jgi:hypothetical protein
VNDLKQILGSPFEGREWIMKMILGSIICIIPVLNLLLLGYFIRCIQCGWRGIHGLPDWDNWADLCRDGCMVLLILLAYLVLPISLALLLLAIPVVGVVFASIIVFIMGFLIPMAIANYAMYKNMRDAFIFVNIFNQVARVFGFYIIAYVAVTLGVIIGTALLLGVPLVGFLGGVFIFYCGVVFFNFLGCLCH